MAPNNDDKISLLQERIAVNERDTSAAHKRIDALDKMMRDDLKELKKEFKEDIKGIGDDVKLLIGFLNQSKGMIAVISVVAGVIAWALREIFRLIFNH